MFERLRLLYVCACSVTVLALVGCTEEAPAEEEEGDITVASVEPADGNRLGGLEVTISGTGFAEDAVVSFGGVAADTTFVSETELTAITPESPAGEADVLVTHDDGHEGSLDAGFEFYGVTLEFIVQNGFRMDDGNTVVYIDAFTGMGSFEADDADVILVSHVMSDHYSRSRVLDAAEANGALVVGPSSILSDLEGNGIDDQLASYDDVMFGESASVDLGGAKLDVYFTQHIGESTMYPHLSYRLELGGMSIFLPGDMNDANWMGPLADYPELEGLDLAMASRNFVNLSTLATFDPAVIVEAHDGGACVVFSDYPNGSEALESFDTFSIPMD